MFSGDPAMLKLSKAEPSWSLMADQAIPKLYRDGALVSLVRTLLLQSDDDY